MRSLIGAQSPIPHSDQVQHRTHFLAILNAFGQSFLQPDIAVFKQNLLTLEALNEKWKLYHKVSNFFFRDKNQSNEKKNLSFFSLFSQSHSLPIFCQFLSKF